ncbi:MAG: histidine phosphatase family protein [Planctomycetes bacterium]|nr:histidine phosphatase family protein [Planctomycetota bacterium]
MMCDFERPFLQSLHVMRHGHSEANASHLIISSLEQGTAAYGLTEQGRDQVIHQVDSWKHDMRSDLAGEIYCSPFLRARATATLASGILKWPAVAEVPALRERCFGDLDQQKDTRYDPVWAHDGLDPAHTHWHVESVYQVRDRVLAFLATLAATYHGQPILLVTHGDTASILLTALRQEDLRRHRRFGALSTAQIQPCIMA